MVQEATPLFVEAREYARSLQLQSSRQWMELAASPAEAARERDSDTLGDSAAARNIHKEDSSSDE